MSEVLLGVVIGGLITGLSTIGIEWLRGQQAANLDSQKRRDDRRIERDRLQRETLLELQVTFNRWARALGRMHHRDVLTLRQHGKLALYPSDISDEELEAGRVLMYLTERVTDEGLRAALTEFRSEVALQHATEAVQGRTIGEDDLNANFFGLMERGSALQSAIGEVLRRYL